LVVIKDTGRRFFDRIDYVKRLTRPRISAEIPVYYAAIFKEMCETRRFIREGIVGKGKMLFDIDKGYR
jgi:hypothetical protein